MATSLIKTVAKVLLPALLPSSFWSALQILNESSIVFSCSLFFLCFVRVFRVVQLFSHMYFSFNELSPRQPNSLVRVLVDSGRVLVVRNTYLKYGITRVVHTSALKFLPFVGHTNNERQKLPRIFLN